MARGKAEAKTVVLHEPKKKPKAKATREQAAQSALERVLDKVESPQASPAKKASPAVIGLRMAKVHSSAQRSAEISFRGGRERILAAVAPEVDPEIVALAAKNQDLVLVESGGESMPLIVGVVQTRIPRDITIKAGTITLEAEREVLLRSGRSALRLREDGDVELVGSRIVTASRGLLRLVGRMLRLN